MTKKIFTLLIMVLVALSLSGCGNVVYYHDGMTDNTLVSTVADTEPVTTLPPVDKNHIMIEYKGMTIGDVIEIWGEDYTLPNSLYRGGWGYIYYEDLPFCFCFRSSFPPVVNKADPLAGIMAAVPDSPESDYYIIEGLPITATSTEIENTIYGEFYRNNVDGGFGFNGEVDGVSVIVDWYENVKGLPDNITLIF